MPGRTEPATGPVWSRPVQTACETSARIRPSKTVIQRILAALSTRGTTRATKASRATASRQQASVAGRQSSGLHLTGNRAETSMPSRRASSSPKLPVLGLPVRSAEGTIRSAKICLQSP